MNHFDKYMIITVAAIAVFVIGAHLWGEWKITEKIKALITRIKKDADYFDAADIYED